MTANSIRPPTTPMIAMYPILSGKSPYMTICMDSCYTVYTQWNILYEIIIYLCHMPIYSMDHFSSYVFSIMYVMVLHAALTEPDDDPVSVGPIVDEVLVGITDVVVGV